MTLQTEPGRGLVDLVRELERRLTGEAPGPGLEPELADSIRHAPTYVLVLFDGLGHHQLAHRSARTLAGSVAGILEVPIPTTTTVSMATIAAGHPPSEHGVLSHLMWLPDMERVVNVLKWVTLSGSPLPYDYRGFIPAPNLWERLSARGIEPITVQPGDFARSPLTQVLYRGCRFEPVYSADEAVEATVALAREPNRLIFTYLPQVDFAAHLWGQSSSEYGQAMGVVDTVWSQVTARSGASVVGTADHGHLDYRTEDKILIEGFGDLTFFGDSRTLFVNGDRDRISELARQVDVEPVFVGADGGPWAGASERVLARAPVAVLPAPTGRLLLPRGFDKRLVGYHGGSLPEEVQVPLLVG